MHVIAYVSAYVQLGLREGSENMHRKYNGVFPTHQGQFRNTEKLEAESIIWTTGLVLVVVNGDYQKKKKKSL